MNAIPEGEVMRNTIALSTRILWFSVLAAALLLLPSRAAAQSATVTDDAFASSSSATQSLNLNGQGIRCWSQARTPLSAPRTWAPRKPLSDFNCNPRSRLGSPPRMSLKPRSSYSSAQASLRAARWIFIRSPAIGMRPR